MKTEDAKTMLLEHSEAKVALYETYLSIYLNVLSRVPSVRKIFIVDPLCGEGIYQNNAKGSPLIALETVRNHYYANNETCPNVTLWFNDNEVSEIEEGVYKVDRVRRFSSTISTPANVNIRFDREDYESILPKMLEEVRRTAQAKGLFFIDPYGYKERSVAEIRTILEVGDTEVLLFMPGSYMYRFAESSTRAPFPGSEHLQRFLTELFGNEIPRFTSAYHFIEQVRDKFRDHLGPKGYFVDTFIIERGHGLVYGLFFFTGNIYGFEKMVEAKWKRDAHHGRGHSHDKKGKPLFSEIESSGYTQKLAGYISGAGHRTNKDLYRFGLEKGFLPKHTNEVLDRWKKQERLEVFTLDGIVARGHYLSHDTERLVGFRLLDDTSSIHSRRG